MIFYVYLDPAVFSLANEHGPYAVQSLISILNGFLQNCFIAEFKDSRIQERIRDHVTSLPNNHERKIIISLLATLQKRNRFVYCLVPDYSGSKDDLKCVLDQAVGTFLDLLLLKEIDSPLVIPEGIEVTALATYQSTDFEARRSRLASDGRTLKEGELDEEEFLNQLFRKALRFAAKIEICDKLFGRKFGDNYEYSAKILFRWLEKVLIDPSRCKLIFHCGKPKGYVDHHIQTQLASFRRGRLSALPVEVQFYQLPNPDHDLPHERFIFTDQIALEIGRGMDFLDKYTRKNRDVSIGYKSLKEVDDLLKDYSKGKLLSMIV